MAAEKAIIDRLNDKLSDDDDDEDSEEYETEFENELDLPLDKLNLVPKKKVLVLCFGGLLVHRVHRKDRATVRGIVPDVEFGNFKVFKRPFSTDFLKFCFERFEVGLWSSARDHNLEGVLTKITGEMRSKLLFVWGQEECTESGFGCLHKEKKPLFLKEVKDMWANLFYKGKCNASNTLMIDDEPHTCLLNPPNTAIFPQAYKKHDPDDTFLGPDGDLRKFLDGLTDADDVPSYVKEHPFGEPAITPAHPDWNYYATVIRKFADERKGDERSAEDE